MSKPFSDRWERKTKGSGVIWDEAAVMALAGGD